MKALIRKLLPKALLHVVEAGFRRGRGLFWQARYGFPARGLKVIAITGTNGKSTSCSYVNEVLKAAGYRTAVVTTVYYEVNGVREPNRTHQTIDRQSIVQKYLAKAKKAKVDWVVLEVTSHAIDQARIMGVPVEIAAITNLTQDHLDYHGTMEEYARVKARLLSDYGAKRAVLNADDQWYSYFAGQSKAEVFAFGKVEGAQAQLREVQTGRKGSSAMLAMPDKVVVLQTSLLGEFNLYNAALAASVGLVIGIDPQKISDGVANLKAVPGRLEPVEAGQDFTVLVDYAYTPDALQNVLTALKQITEGKVRIVFGATGDRDKTKRPAMGEAAAKHADVIYLTDDETYTEDPETIRQAVYAGIEWAGGADKTEVIADRKEAIRVALTEAKAGDTVLLTGIGHEETRNMGGTLLPWDEVQIAKEILANKSQTKPAPTA